MLLDHFAALVTVSPSLDALRVGRLAVWSAHADDRLTDEEAAVLERAVERRRRELEGLGAAPESNEPPPPPSPLADVPDASSDPYALFRSDSARTGRLARPFGASRAVVRLSRFSTGKKPPRSPDREESRERALDRVRSNPLPRSVRGLTFMTVAVLAVIAEEVVERGVCALTHGEIATRAGGSVSTSKRAIAEAVRRGLVDVSIRPRPLAPNLPNLIRVVSAEWWAWLAGRPRALRRKAKELSAEGAGSGGAMRGGGRGSKRTAPFNNPSSRDAMNAVQSAIEGVAEALIGPEPPPGRLRPG